MASSFSGRENRRIKAAMLITDNYSNGDWFTVHDIMDLWAERWIKCLTEKELSKTIPIFTVERPGCSILEYEFRKGHNYKYYRLVVRFDDEGNPLPLYQKRDRDI